MNFEQYQASMAIPTELHVYPGAFHGFEKMVPTAAISKRAIAEYIAALRQALDSRV